MDSKTSLDLFCMGGGSLGPGPDQDPKRGDSNFILSTCSLLPGNAQVDVRYLLPVRIMRHHMH